MKLDVESTEQLVSIGEGRVARVWVGRTAEGIPVQLLVARVAVPEAQDQSPFLAALVGTHAPPPVEPAFPRWMLL